MTIIDTHAHVFPFMGGANGYDSVSDHVIYLQKVAAQSLPSPVRRLRDGRIVEDRALWSSWEDGDPTFKGAQNVNFRVGPFGRYVWTKEGVDYSIHFCAPNLQNSECPAEYVLAEMDYAGVDKALLQNPYLYGQLDDYIADVVQRHPNRFIGQAQINELEAGSSAQVARLRRQVGDLGLKGGVYYTNARFFERNFTDQMDDAKFLPFWEEVNDCGIPVFADIRGIPSRGGSVKPIMQMYIEQMRMIADLLDKFRNVTCVLVHGIPMRVFRNRDGLVPIPEEVWEIWRRPNVHLEILFPIQVSYPAVTKGKWELTKSSQWDYPFREVQPMIKDLYHKLGPEKLLWGSDIPFILRNCTYKQSLDYLARYCDFISSRDMELILGGNAARILNLGS